MLLPTYYLPYRATGRGVGSFLVTFGLFLVVTTGLAPHNATAVAMAIRSRRAEFIRTPKRGSGGAPGYVAPSSRGMEATELAVWGLMLGAISIAAAHSSLYVMWLPLVAFVGLTAVLAAMALDRARSRGDSAEGSRLASLSGLARCRLTTARPTGRTPRR